MHWRKKKQMVLFAEDPYYLASQTGVAISCLEYLQTKNPNAITKELYIFLFLYCGFPISKSLKEFRIRYKDGKKKGIEKFNKTLAQANMVNAEKVMSYNGSKSNIYDIKNVLKNYATMYQKQGGKITKVTDGEE